MDPLDKALDKILADYAAVEPRPEAVQTWMARRAAPAPQSSFLRLLRTPAWTAVAAALLLILAVSGIHWYRARVRAETQARLAAGEKTVLVPLPPSMAPPLTDREKQLIQLMQTNPAALATQKPGKPHPDKTAKHP